jgi:hypothetical protein
MTMGRMRGWGLLFAVGVPLLIFFSWSRLGNEKSRINLERFQEWSGGDASGIARPLQQYFVENKKLARPSDVVMPAIPPKSGVKAWAVQPDTTVLVELDAILDGRKVQLKLVPIRGGNGVYYDCVSATSPVHVGRFCRADVLKSDTDIPAQLAANAQAPSPQATAATGSVLVVPEKVSDLNDCGLKCVKRQSCVNPRPLACTKTVETTNSSTQDVVPTASDFSGNKFATRAEADQACEQALGAGYRVLSASSVYGTFKLGSGYEYWVHHGSPERNCWKSE